MLWNESVLYPSYAFSKFHNIYLILLKYVSHHILTKSTSCVNCHRFFSNLKYSIDKNHRLQQQTWKTSGNKHSNFLAKIFWDSSHGVQEIRLELCLTDKHQEMDLKVRMEDRYDHSKNVKLWFYLLWRFKVLHDAFIIWLPTPIRITWWRFDVFFQVPEGIKWIKTLASS